jgi:group I intron endonuclease
MQGTRFITKKIFYSTENYKPEKLYPNTDVAKIQILLDNKNRPGIYLWRNLINGKTYVGSSGDLRVRLRSYFDINNLERQNSMPINRALLKYGYSNFSLEILEYCDKSELLTREKYYFNLLNPDYNISKEPGSPMLGRKHSKETLEKLAALQLGRKRSEETRAKMSAAKQGISTGGNQPNSQKIEVLDLELDSKTTYDSIRKAAKALSCSQTTISGQLKSINPKPYKGRYIFSFT